MPKPTTLSRVMKQLEDQGDEKVRQRYVRDGAGDNVFGVLLGKIRGLAESLGTNPGLGLELWETDARRAPRDDRSCRILDRTVARGRRSGRAGRRRCTAGFALTVDER